MPAFGGGGGGGGGGLAALGGLLQKKMQIPAAATAGNSNPEPAAAAAPTPPPPQLGPGQNLIAPKRGRGELKQMTAGMRAPLCGACGDQIRSWLDSACPCMWCHLIPFSDPPN